MSLVKLARPEIREMHAYDAAAQVDDTVRLNANESPYNCEVGHFRRPLNRYPEVRPRQLQRALAQRFGCEPEQLLVTRGSSEAIDLVIRTFCAAGEHSVMVSSPSFSMYEHYARVQGAQLIKVATLAADDFVVDIDAMLSACDDETRVIFVCSPNNPTGTSLPRADLERLLAARSERSAVIVDEAYIEFGHGDSAVDLLERYPNLLILRTLSKALGFAGARCGAVIGPGEAIAMLNAVQAPYALATPVIECVEEALQGDYLRQAEEAVKATIVERDRLSEAFAAFAFVEKVWPSDANFVLIRVTDAAGLMQHCAAQRILLRHFGGELEDCIRISIGSRNENDQLLAAFASFCPGNAR